ncbi:MAG: hypothetical protein ACI9G9_001529 [Psychromonas sp.]|jgi:hypothetical protein
MKISTVISSCFRSKYSGIFWFLLFYCLAILVRLPHLLSDNLFFDGDEAVIGVMANDLLLGKGIPLYFYGQNYGLSIVEVSSVGFWIMLIGKGIWALRLGGLLVFSGACTFLFFGLLKRNLSKSWAFYATFLLIIFPSWLLWGAMVRGGYVTGLLSICALFYLLSDLRTNFFRLLAISFFFALAYESHLPLLIPILPFLLRDAILQKFPIWRIILALAMAAGIVFLFKWLNVNGDLWHEPALISNWYEVYIMFKEQIKNVLPNYGDFFFFTMNFNLPTWCKPVLSLSLISLLLLGLMGGIRTKKKRIWYFLSILAMLSMFVLFSFVPNYSPRYMISIFTGFLFLLFFLWNEISVLKKGKALLFFFGFVSFIFTFAGSKMKRDWYDTSLNCMTAFEELHTEVTRLDKKAVFITDVSIQWQWNYLYGHEIPATAFRQTERTNEFAQKTIQIYKRNPEKTAIIGLWGMFFGIDEIPGFNDRRYQVNAKYFVMPEVLPTFFEKGWQVMNP